LGWLGSLLIQGAVGGISGYLSTKKVRCWLEIGDNEENNVRTMWMVVVNSGRRTIKGEVIVIGHVRRRERSGNPPENLPEKSAFETFSARQAALRCYALSAGRLSCKSSVPLQCSTPLKGSHLRPTNTESGGRSSGKLCILQATLCLCATGAWRR
jgi:hypothetical protein